MKSKTSKSAKILKMLADGISVKDAAKKAGTSPNYVYFVKWRAANPTGKKLAKSRRKVAKEKVVEKTWHVMPMPAETNAALRQELTRLDEELKPVEDPFDVQIGGNHYKNMAIQPMEYSMMNKLDPCQHTVVKYVSRFREAGGTEDLEKAKHVIDMLIKFEEERLAE